jgi:hypothetical protein
MFLSFFDLALPPPRVPGDDVLKIHFNAVFVSLLGKLIQEPSLLPKIIDEIVRNILFVSISMELYLSELP